MTNLLEENPDSSSMYIEKQGDAFRLTLDNWKMQDCVIVDLSLKDLINIEGHIHALILEHEMGDSYNEPKSRGD